MELTPEQIANMFMLMTVGVDRERQRDALKELLRAAHQAGWEAAERQMSSKVPQREKP